MNHVTPIFPLELVVYPGEPLNLHIFEPRYKQLIHDCAKTKIPFAIPSVVKKKIGDLGTLVELVEITQVHEGGEMDVKTRGLKVCRILELVKLVPGKLYGGAVLELLETDPAGNDESMRQLLAGVKQLLQILKVEKKFAKPESRLKSYDVAHHAGLTLEQQYEFLGILDERSRQDYLNGHLAKILPVVMEMELLKEKIQFNGHFKPLVGFEI